MSHATTRQCSWAGPGDCGLDAAESSHLRMQVGDDAGSERRIPLLFVSHDKHVICNRGEPFKHESKHGLPARDKRQKSFVSTHAPALPSGERSGAERRVLAGSSRFLRSRSAQIQDWLYLLRTTIIAK